MTKPIHEKTKKIETVGSTEMQQSLDAITEPYNDETSAEITSDSDVKLLKRAIYRRMSALEDRVGLVQRFGAMSLKGQSETITLINGLNDFLRKQALIGRNTGWDL